MASKNQEPKKQETKKMILWEITESENEKRSWKSQFEPKSTYLNLVWTMFYYFILIVQKLNFPPSWIIQCPFCYLIFGTNPTLFGIPFHSQKSNSACWCWLCNWNAKLKKPQTINGCTFTLSPHNSNTKYQKIFFM